MTERREEEDLKTPWTFKLMVVLVVLYLGWRLIEILAWIWNAIF